MNQQVDRSESHLTAMRACLAEAARHERAGDSVRASIAEVCAAQFLARVVEGEVEQVAA